MASQQQIKSTPDWQPPAINREAAQSTFAQYAWQYLERGISVVPIAPGSKKPGVYDRASGWRGMSDWTRFATRMPTELEIEYWSTFPDAGIGIVLGPISKLVGIDRDYDTDGTDALDALIPYTPFKKKGEKGYTAFFQFNGERSCSFNINGVRVMDVLAEGRQTVVPPTMHPTGCAYVWTGELPLTDIDSPLDLPKLPDDFIAQVEKVIAPYQNDEDRKYQKKHIAPREDGDRINTGLTLHAEYFRDINRLALDQLEAWVPKLIDTAVSHKGGYRCKATWRNAENRNVGISPAGIFDFGGNYGMTAIDLVMHSCQVPFRGAVDLLRACLTMPEVEEITFAPAVKDDADPVVVPIRPASPPPATVLPWLQPLASPQGADQVAGAPNPSPAPPTSLDRCVVDLKRYIAPDTVHSHIVEKWLPEGEVTLCAGHGGAGKSYFALIVAVHVALGRPLALLKVTQRRVLFFSAEDDADELLRRLARICRVLGVNQSELEGWLHLLDVSDLDPTLYRPALNGSSQTQTMERLDELVQYVQRHNIGLTVIDNASDTYDGKEIERAQVRAFIRGLRQKIARPNRAVLLLAHVSKSAAVNKRNGHAENEDYSGSTAWHNSVRSRLSLDSEKDGRIIIKHMKANKGPKAADVQFEWRDGAPIPADATDLPGAQLTAAAHREAQERQDQADKAALLALVKDFDRRGERLPTTGQGPANTFKTLKSCPTFPPGVTKDRLAALMRGLEQDGQIYRTDIRGSGGRQINCFVCSKAGTDSSPIPPAGVIPSVSDPNLEGAVDPPGLPNPCAHISPHP